jgi:hypothetical protein
MSDKPTNLVGEWVATPVIEPGMVLIAALDVTADEINAMPHAERGMYEAAALRANELGRECVRVDRIRMCKQRRSVRDDDRIEFYQYRGPLND